MILETKTRKERRRTLIDHEVVALAISGVPIEEIARQARKTPGAIYQAISTHGRLYPEYKATLERTREKLDENVKKIVDRAKEVAPKAFGTLEKMSYGDVPGVTDGGRYKSSEKILELAGAGTDTFRSHLDNITYDEAVAKVNKVIQDIHRRCIYPEHQGNIIRLISPTCNRPHSDENLTFENPSFPQVIENKGQSILETGQNPVNPVNNIDSQTRYEKSPYVGGAGVKEIDHVLHPMNVDVNHHIQNLPSFSESKGTQTLPSSPTYASRITNKRDSDPVQVSPSPQITKSRNINRGGIKTQTRGGIKTQTRGGIKTQTDDEFLRKLRENP